MAKAMPRPGTGALQPVIESERSFEDCFRDMFRDDLTCEGVLTINPRTYKHNLRDPVAEMDRLVSIAGEYGFSASHSRIGITSRYNLHYHRDGEGVGNARM